MAQNTTTDGATEAQPTTVAELSDENTEALHSIYAAARRRADDRHASWDHRDAGYQTARNVEEVLADRGIPTEEVRSRYEEVEDR